jgi:glycerol-3-phosphate dehydrogenase
VRPYPTWHVVLSQSGSPTASTCLTDDPRRDKADDAPQAKEVHNFLEARNRVDAYPLFNNVYKVCWEDHPVEKLTEGI